MSEQKYRLRISRLTIDKLGIQMYDKVSAVLAELIANAYDADAENVTVTLPFGKMLGNIDGDEAITIEDDGLGMDPDQVNEYYLNVGYDRRQNRGDATPSGRRVMGRKGIGKLAPFGICHEVEVMSAGGDRTAAGYPVAHLILDFDAMLKDEVDEEGRQRDYSPTLGSRDGSFAESSGTTITLRRFDRKRVPSCDVMNRQLSARFGIRRDDWRVRVVNSINDESSFELGDLPVATMDGSKVDVDEFPLIVNGANYPVTGWIAYSKEPYKDEIMAGVRIYCRGKFVSQTRDFDIKSGFTGEFKMRSYVTGEIHAEWLDNDANDLIRTDRQDIIWTTEVGSAFKNWGQKLLKKVAKNSEGAARRQTWSEFLEKSKLKERLHQTLKGRDDLRDAILEAARILVRHLSGDALKDKQYIDDVAQLAYTVGPHRKLLESLREVGRSDRIELSMLLRVFETARIAEHYSLGQIASERVKVIRELNKLIENGDTRELQLQRLVESATWLLYPDWTPIGMNEALTTVQRTYTSWYRTRNGRDVRVSSTEKDARRPDFVMLAHGRRLQVVEIKRPMYKLENDDYQRAVDYLQSVSDFVKETTSVDTTYNEVGLIIVCDKIGLSSANNSSIENDNRIQWMTWHDLLERTQVAHQAFITAADQVPDTLPELQAR